LVPKKKTVRSSAASTGARRFCSPPVVTGRPG
jgi:hypothetical protein